MPDQQPRDRFPPARRRAAASGAVACLVALLLTPFAARAALLDDFEDLSSWSTGASEGVSVEIAQDEGQRGMAMRLDFDFKGHAGYLVARKQVSWPLPEDYAFTFYIRGEAPENNLEIKFVDASGQNVWWSSQRHFEFSSRWRKLTIKKRHIEFAWGPNPGELKEVAYVEFAIAAGRGGEGSVWIDQLSFAERDLGPYDLTPELKASTSTEGSSTAAVLDDDPASAWHSGAVSDEQWLLIDFKKLREYGGLVIDWADEDFATTYEVQISDDEREWQSAFRVEAGNGGRDYIYLPETESRYLRLDLKQSARGAGYGIRSIEVQPYQFASSPNHFFAAIAKDAPRGGCPEGADRRGWPGRARGRLGFDRALPVPRRSARDLERRRAAPGARGRLPADTERDLDPAFGAAWGAAQDHRARGRRARPLVALAALPGQQRIGGAAEGSAVPRAAPVPGEPALAVARHRRGRDPRPGAGLCRGPGEHRPR
ncbi:MAG: putative discoidin domain protein [Geminicoccaceae bacterium]|nr:putative discoidin domain protein [Geminicoccaceae bacterium]